MHVARYLQEHGSNAYTKASFSHGRTQTQKVWCHAGEVTLFSWAEWLKQQQHLWAPAPPPEPISPPPQDSDAELAAALQQVRPSS